MMRTLVLTILEHFMTDTFDSHHGCTFGQSILFNTSSACKQDRFDILSYDIINETILI